MAWVKLDDGYYDNVKVSMAGPLAELLYVRGIAWANRNRTDGRITTQAVERLSTDLVSILSYLNNGREMSPHDIAANLVATGCWEEQPYGYTIHDYLEHQTSAAVMRQQRGELHAKRSAAGKAGAAVRWGVDQPSPNGEVEPW